MEKKTPERMCVACRGMFPKKEMLRIVRSPEGAIDLDFTGKKSGRGAYICNKRECFERCAKTRQLNRAFKCEVPAAVYEALKSRFEEQ